MSEQPDSTVDNDSIGEGGGGDSSPDEGRVAPKLFLKALPGGTFQSSPSSSKRAVPQLVSKPSINKAIVSSSSSPSMPAGMGGRMKPISSSHVSSKDGNGDPTASSSTASHLPRPRFLNTGTRNFLKPRKTLPGLTPITDLKGGGTSGSTPTSSLLNRGGRVSIVSPATTPSSSTEGGKPPISPITITTKSTSGPAYSIANPLPVAKVRIQLDPAESSFPSSSATSSDATCGEPSSSGGGVSGTPPPVPPITPIRIQSNKLVTKSPSYEIAKGVSPAAAASRIRTMLAPPIRLKKANTPISTTPSKLNKFVRFAARPPTTDSVRLRPTPPDLLPPFIADSEIKSSPESSSTDSSPQSSPVKITAVKETAASTQQNLSKTTNPPHSSTGGVVRANQPEPEHSSSSGAGIPHKTALIAKSRITTALARSQFSIPDSISISPVFTAPPKLTQQIEVGSGGGVVRPIKIPTSRMPSKAALQRQIQHGFKNAAMSVAPSFAAPVRARIPVGPQTPLPAAATSSSTTSTPTTTTPSQNRTPQVKEIEEEESQPDSSTPESDREKELEYNKKVAEYGLKELTVNIFNEPLPGLKNISPKDKDVTVTPVSSTNDVIVPTPDGDGGDGNGDGDSSARRTGRRRKPTKHFETSFVPPTRRRKLDMGENGNDDASKTPSSSSEITPGDTPSGGMLVMKPRGRPRGTGRGRGRPRGSTLKAKLERESLNAVDTVKIEKTDGDEGEEGGAGGGESGNMSITSSNMDESGEEKMSVLDISSPSPIRGTRGRGRGSRGGRGLPYTPRGSRRGGRGSRGARGAARNILLAKRRAQIKKTEVEIEKAKKAASNLEVFEDETRMSSDGTDVKLADVNNLFKDKITSTDELPPPTPSTLNGVGVDEEASNLSSTSASLPPKKKSTKDFIDDRKPVTAETLFEYKWPQDSAEAEYFFLQEQIIEYLGHKSFRRKYPNLRRRPVEMVERDFLRGQKVVSETQCDLGLTAVNSSEVLDILYNDFPKKYEEYRKIEEERKEKELTQSQIASTTTAPVVRDRSAEFMARIIKSCAKFNAALNQDRRELRSQSYDLQTCTMNVPAGRMKVLPPEKTKMGYFPVAVLPGQYTDGYKSYTPIELKYFPMNTVIYGPVQENRMAEESDEDESDSASSSSGDSSSSSSDDDGSETEDKVANEPVTSTVEDSKDMLGICKTCNGGYSKNKLGRNEMLIHCAKCDSANHPTCLELTMDMVPFIKKYDWQCTDCKNCIECNDPADEDKMLFCDCCDRGYHIYCVGLRKVPNGRWHCVTCSICFSCGVNEPATDDRAAEWHHEYKKGEKGSKYYIHSLCVSCHKIYKKGQYCPACLKCHLKLDDKNLVECRSCEKWVHKHCVKKPLQTKFGFLCDSCESSNFTARTKLPPARRN